MTFGGTRDWKGQSTLIGAVDVASDKPVEDRLTAALAARYHIEREIGSGGMATVYLAQDPKHDRKVAVKVLKPELAAAVGGERFLSEIKVTANLQHPNILPLFDSGEVKGFLFFVMPYVEGEALQARLQREGQRPVEEALTIATQILGALAYAHKRGIVHRDIKPANILLGDEHAFLADFGVAKAVYGAEGATLTQTGGVVGTPLYMSPEQAAGENALTGAADIYAMGCVLYEMLAGHPPFSGPNAQGILARHMADPPPPLGTVRPSMSPDLTHAVALALEKSPADRFASAELFRAALMKGLAESGAQVRVRREGGLPPGVSPSSGVDNASGPAKRTIAVLPLQNMSGDPSQAFFADGMTEALITDLAKIQDFRVTSRTSVMRYRETTKSIPEIARDLGVDLILEGSVIRAEDQVRVTAQLIDVATDAHLWAESYDRRVTNILSLQTEVAREVAQEVKGRLSTQDRARLGAQRSVDPAAHDAYLKGRHFWNLRGDNIQKGLQWFRRSLELDPEYAPAHAGIADTYALLGFYGVMRPLDAMPKAKEAARRALELDDQLGEPHACLGYVHTVFDWRWGDAEREFRKAFELNPSNGSYWYWHANLLGAVGRLDEAIDLLEKGLEYDPLNIYMHMHLGLTLFTAGRYSEAEEAYKRSLELEPTLHGARSSLGLVYHFQGRTDEGLREMIRGVEESGRQQFNLWFLGSTYADLGRVEDAEALLSEMMERRKREFVFNGFIASIHALLGHKDEAFRWLDLAFEEREFVLAGWGLHLPSWTFRGLEDDPRFIEILDRVREAAQ